MARIKILILLFLTAAFISGCSKCPSGTKAAEVVVSINNYDITRDEFETLFRESAYGKSDTPESRREFLGNLIDRKLILQYAQKEGLDREGAFLKMIESFWEQSLLKVALDRKNREIPSPSKSSMIIHLLKRLHHPNISIR